MRPVVHVSEVLVLADADYRYGTGPLRLRVTRVGQVERHADGQWLDLEGIELRQDGTPITGQARYALVRVSALQHQQRFVDGMQHVAPMLN